MKLKNKILLVTIMMLFGSCVKTTEEKEDSDFNELEKVEVEIPYFWFSSNQIDYFSFYGRDITIKINSVIINDFDLETNDTAQIRELVENLKDKDFDKTVKMLIDQAKEMDLDAFGYGLLLKKFIKEIFGDKTKNFKAIVMWYGLRTNNIDAVICTNKKRIICYSIEFIPDDQIILDLSFDLFQEYERNEFVFSNKMPKLGKLIFSKKRTFVYKERKYHLKTSYNKYMIQYLNDLPMEFGNHLFEREFSTEVKQSFDSVPIWLEDKTMYDKIDFLLTLVDESFPHSGGDKVEKYNYVEQTMKDNYVDCEDRAAMFCYLIKEFTNSKTSLVVNDNHAWSIVSNDYKKNLMCDPGLKPGEMLEPKKPYTIMDP